MELRKVKRHDRNRWEPIVFDQIKPGDSIRLFQGDEVVDEFIAKSYPEKRIPFGNMRVKDETGSWHELMVTQELIADPDRYLHSRDDTTGIYVRAQLPDGRFGVVDLAIVDRDSLLFWLKTQGCAISVINGLILHLLGHQQ